MLHVRKTTALVRQFPKAACNAEMLCLFRNLMPRHCFDLWNKRASLASPLVGDVDRWRTAHWLNEHLQFNYNKQGEDIQRYSA